MVCKARAFIVLLTTRYNRCKCGSSAYTENPHAYRFIHSFLYDIVTSLLYICFLPRTFSFTNSWRYFFFLRVTNFMPFLSYSFPFTFSAAADTMTLLTFCTQSLLFRWRCCFISLSKYIYKRFTSRHCICTNAHNGKCCKTSLRKFILISSLSIS